MLRLIRRLSPAAAAASSPPRRSAHRRSAKPPPPPPPPTPPKAPQKPLSFTVHGITWTDPYIWMSDIGDAVAMRHMDVCMEAEEKYLEATMAAMGAERLSRKLQLEMACRLASDLCSYPVKWGPWLYYRRVEEGKEYKVLCRRPAKVQEELFEYVNPSSGFDFVSGKKIEQILVDYNAEAERFGGYACEEYSEVSPDHRYLAYTMYDKDKDSFTLCVRDLTSGSLCDKPQVDRVANVSWAMNGKALLYTVTNKDKRPYQIYCSMIGSNSDDVLILEESDEIYLNIRNTKDFQFVTVNAFSNTSSEVYLINAADPLSGMTLVWEGEPNVHCVIEHHRGYLYLFTDAARGGAPVDSHYLLRCTVEASSSKDWENVFFEEPGMTIEDVDFCDTHMVLVVKEGKRFRLCSLALPLPTDGKGAARLTALRPCFLPLPNHVCQIASGPNYDYYSSTMRFLISSPVMPDAVVDYNLLNGKWIIVQQQNVLHERTRILYGTTFSADVKENSPLAKNFGVSREADTGNIVWNDLSEFYACEYYDVPSEDNFAIPLTIVYSKKHKQATNPGLLHGHGAYGELLDKRWSSDLRSLLDRGWVIAYADVRGGGGSGKKWHHDGRRTKKQNSINDYIACAKFLIEEGITHENKLAGFGYSAGGLLVASAINACPDLFRAAVLKVPFLDACNTLIHPIIPLTPIDYEEFGYPVVLEDFVAIRKYSPYENIQKDVLYPSILVTASLDTRFGVWEAAKWIARIREQTIYDPKRPVLLNLQTEMVEGNKYLQTKELAFEAAFLIKTMMDP